MRITEPSVEELAVFGLGYKKNFVDVDFNWTFPCLKVLESDRFSSKLCSMLVHCRTLVKLHWPMDYPTNYSLSAILRLNHNIKELCISAIGSLLDHLTFELGSSWRNSRSIAIPIEMVSLLLSKPNPSRWSP